MTIKSRMLIFVTVILFASMNIVPAFAHRFNVALVIALSGNDVDMGRQYREGFMLATTQRDAHANEESDGHLGGLDVYVSTIDTNGDVSGEISRILAEGEIDIVAAMASEDVLATLASLLEGGNIALLTPGQSPFSQSANPAVASFSSAFEKQYGAKPTGLTAQGYNAAWRIDVAVREQGAADNTDALLESFGQSASGFTWQQN